MLSRRSLLRGLGASALSLPLLESLGRPAFAQDATYPTRLILVSRGQGTLADSLVLPGGSSTNFSLGPILDPLTPFQSRLALCTGVDDATNTLDGNYNGHTRCLLHTWTAQGMTWGASSGGGTTPTGAGGVSIDQLIASRWAGATAHESLGFGVGASTQTNQSYSWKGVGQPVPVENNPTNNYDRLFLDLVGADPVEIAARQSRRQRVLDAVQRQFDEVLPRVGADERTKLENHVTSLQGLQQSLNGAAVGDACSNPSVDLSNLGDYELRSHAQIDMLAMAFACDLTRVANLTFGDYQDWSFQGIDFPSGWHDAVHAGPVSADRRAALTGSYQWYAEQLAYLMTALDAIPEGNGTVLDHTLILSGNVFSDGSIHSHTGKAYLLAGGAAGLIGGRHHDLTGSTNSELFTAILQGLGFDDPSFGDPNFCRGPVTGVFA